MAHDHAGHGHSGHDHSGNDHGHGHSHLRSTDRRRLGWTLVVTITFLVAEVAGGVVSHSLALLSDAGHMLSDVVAQLLALVAIIVAARPADHRRTYGWYRLEIFGRARQRTHPSGARGRRDLERPRCALATRSTSRAAS